jgi:hypothetical protein
VEVATPDAANPLDAAAFTLALMLADPNLSPIERGLMASHQATSARARRVYSDARRRLSTGMSISVVG